MIKGSIYQKDIMNLKEYAPENRGSKYKQEKVIILKEKVDKSTVTDGDFNTHLSVIDRISRQQITRIQKN